MLGWFYYFRSKFIEKNSLKQAMLFLALLALIYTTPWDNYLVKTGVWIYKDQNILFKIGYVPIEEYIFFILQTMLTSFWSLFVLNRISISKATSNSSTIKKYIFLLLVFSFGLSILFLFHAPTRYLGLILVWCIPVFILQWFFGGQHVIKNFRAYVFCLIPPTLYLWCVDGFAIYKQTWEISSIQTTGLKIFTLPIEEALFFLVTNIMLCQGIILYILLKEDFIRLFRRTS